MIKCNPYRSNFDCSPDPFPMPNEGGRRHACSSKSVIHATDVSSVHPKSRQLPPTSEERFLVCSCQCIHQGGWLSSRRLLTIMKRLGEQTASHTTATVHTPSLTVSSGKGTRKYRDTNDGVSGDIGQPDGLVLDIVNNSSRVQALSRDGSSKPHKEMTRVRYSSSTATAFHR
jgi:hypothetical protein